MPSVEPRTTVPLPRLQKGFQLTSGTLFASHKLPLRAYLAAIAIFCNEVKGKSALALSRDLYVSYKYAFVLLHKLREAMAAELRGRISAATAKWPRSMAAISAATFQPGEPHTITALIAACSNNQIRQA